VLTDRPPTDDHLDVAGDLSDPRCPLPPRSLARVHHRTCGARTRGGSMSGEGSGRSLWWTRVSMSCGTGRAA